MSTATSLKFPRTAYHSPHSSWPYKPRDFDRQDPSSDSTFYGQPRFVTHIDDNAIRTLGEYYAEVLPTKGRILDLCSSWISHFPPSLVSLTTLSNSNPPNLQVVGVGMSQVELQENPILSTRIVQDLNDNSSLQNTPPLQELDAVTCVVSIDYLIHPVEVLESCRERLRDNGRIHLIISNRCFPTKAIRRWLEINEQERLEMVGDYLHFAGFQNVEFVTLSQGGGGYWNHVDPLWAVTGIKSSLSST